MLIVYLRNKATIYSSACQVNYYLFLALSRQQIGQSFKIIVKSANHLCLAPYSNKDYEIHDCVVTRPKESLNIWIHKAIID